jgi:hypothetical protein
MKRPSQYTSQEIATLLIAPVIKHKNGPKNRRPLYTPHSDKVNRYEAARSLPGTTAVDTFLREHPYRHKVHNISGMGLLPVFPGRGCLTISFSVTFRPISC